ncbi:hypothetical protein EKO27_g11192 [Xylaria grammica]|uniref:C2H2-type domain-containing protein n=1 Tax=Xylaria grammica TaxID=363999 RepID=A0A439CP42_9PEZI|nr:hypothetical protein EKO27_g11192 [Xylaria grammica]
MEQTIGGPQEAIPCANKIPGQVEIQPNVFSVSSLAAFSPTGLGTLQTSLNSSFNTPMFGLDLSMLPPNNLDSLVDSFPLANVSLGDPLLSDPPPIYSLPLNDIPSCSRCHKNHRPWPKKGVLEIQKCERKCHYCGQELKTAAALRKHVKNHKIKDKFDIEILQASSGRQRRALLPEEVPGALVQQSSAAARFDAYPKDVNGGSELLRHLQSKVTELEKRTQVAEAEKEAILKKYKLKDDDSAASRTPSRGTKDPPNKRISPTSRPTKSHSSSTSAVPLNGGSDGGSPRGSSGLCYGRATNVCLAGNFEALKISSTIFLSKTEVRTVVTETADVSMFRGWREERVIDAHQRLEGATCSAIVRKINGTSRRAG